MQGLRAKGTSLQYAQIFHVLTITKKKQTWDKAILEDSPLVSPFIHPTEREYLEKVTRQGGKAIIIKENGSPERWKPEKSQFEACAQGRLLFIAPKEHNTRRQSLTRASCLRLNTLAKPLSAIRPGAYTLLRK